MSKKKNMYKLESLARLISGRTPEREQKEYYAETGTPWVKIENLDQGSEAFRANHSQCRKNNRM